MCVQCVQAGASVVPAALAVLGGMVWKHRRDELRDGQHAEAETAVETAN